MTTGDTTYAGSGIKLVYGSPSVTFSSLVVDYKDGYKSADVSVAVNVNSEDITYSLKTNNVVVSGVSGVVSGSVVTFAGVDTSELAIGDTSFQIVAESSGTTVATSELTTVIKGDTNAWFETSDGAGNTVGGSWTNDTAWANGVMTINDGDNAFKPDESSKGEVVTVTTVAKFFAINNTDEAISGQAAIRIGGTDESPTFQLYREGGWVNVTATGINPNVNAEYEVVFTFNYSASSAATYSATIAVYGGTAQQLMAAGDVTTFTVAGTNPKTLSMIDFVGTGSIRSIVGQYISNGLVVDTDANNTVVVASAWVSSIPVLAAMSVADAKVALAADAPATSGPGNGYNWFSCYALGLIDGETVNTPAMSEASVDNGEVTFGLLNVNPPEGVELTVTLEGCTTPGGEYSAVDGSGSMTITHGTASAETAGTVSLNPVTAQGESSVKYYRLKIDVGAK